MLKNEDERRAFLRDYLKWPIWITVPELGMRMFRADLPDGSYILVAQYLRSEKDAALFGHLWGWSNWHLVKKDAAFCPQPSNFTEMIEHLKGIKSEKGGSKK